MYETNSSAYYAKFYAFVSECTKEASWGLWTWDLGLDDYQRTLFSMPKYDVYVVCDQCGQPHAVNVKLELAEGGLDRTPVADAFEGKPLPSVLTFMQTNKYRCPHTKLLFSAEDIGDAMLFAK